MTYTREMLLAQEPNEFAYGAEENAAATAALHIMSGTSTHKVIAGADLYADVYDEYGEKNWRALVVHEKFALISPNGGFCQVFLGDKLEALTWAAASGYVSRDEMAMHLCEADISEDQRAAALASCREAPLSVVSA